MFLTVCGGGGASDKHSDPTNALGDPSLGEISAQIYTQNITIPTLTLTNTGGGLLTSCTADSLPQGLSIEITVDGNSCEVFGTASEPQLNTVHTITAFNETGESSSTISISVEVFRKFSTLWKTDNPGASEDNQIQINTEGTGYNYNVDWGDSTQDENVTGGITHTYSTPGTYTVSISGSFPRMVFEENTDNLKILSIDQWGGNQWQSMGGAFKDCENLEGNAVDTPDLTDVTDMSHMFDGVELSPANYDALLIGWSNRALQSSVVFSAGSSKYSSSTQSHRDLLTNSFGWAVTDGGVAN